MATISELKELGVTQTPLFLFQFHLASGTVLYWSTHCVEVDGVSYEARVTGHNLFEMRSDANEGIDNLGRISVTLANADSYCSQIERAIGWKGAQVTVRFLFFDLHGGRPASEATVVFSGVANAPDEITESSLRLPVSNRMNLQRLLAPQVRIQRRCPWKFPSSREQREEAASGGQEGKYSLFYRCGYAPDVQEGRGRMGDGGPYTGCDYTRAQCEQRGMFDRDGEGRVTRRFGGIEFVPPTIQVRGYGEKSVHASAVAENEARYNDFAPLVYGTVWYAPPVVFARNDGNLTRMEVLLGLGEIEGVLKVVVNGTEIPAAQPNLDMTATGWHLLVSRGTRDGAFNSDFTQADGSPAGDPYGSMAFLSVVTPNRINDGSSLPKIRVLLEGLRVPRYGTNGALLDEAFDNNPSWVILDLLRRCGWKLAEIDVASFAAAAAFCAGLIPARDLNGNETLIPRFQCNLVLRNRRSLADVIRGIRNASSLYLANDSEGRLQLRAESTMAQQHATKTAGSNSTETLNGGWPCYEFGDGTEGKSGILRRSDGQPAIRFWSRSTADTANRFSVEFQDAFNEYQQDSLSLVDLDDVARTGQEISASVSALGIPNFHQAARLIQLQLHKSIRGNVYVRFETSVRGIHLRPGDLITLTYLKEGFLRVPFRISSVAPGLNYRTAVITAQIHDDSWYTDAADEGNPGGRRQPSYEVGLPRPLSGSVLDEDGEPQLEIFESAGAPVDEAGQVRLRVGFVVPPQPSRGNIGAPLVNLSATVSENGGALQGGQTLYYAVSAVGADGSESALSFLVRAAIPAGTEANSVRLSGLSFAANTASFHVYRGRDTQRLYRIATAEPAADSFVDTGRAPQLCVPPDENFDHANFYWRLELQPEQEAGLHSADSIGDESLEMPENGYRGMTVRITKGKGKGQERTIASNSVTLLTVRPPWAAAPDSTSRFVIAEAGWHTGAAASRSPVEIDAPARTGATVHVCGRAANVHNRECAYELSPVTRWRIGGETAAAWDSAVASAPVFGLRPTGGGSVDVVAIGFEELTNTRTVTSGTLTLHYWPELASPAAVQLAAGVDGADDSLVLNCVGSAQPGSLVQVGAEILLVNDVLEGGQRYGVERGVLKSTAEAHSERTPVYHLEKRVYVLPFTKDFFGSPSAGNYVFPIRIPDVRIAAAEMHVTNMRGNSETGQACLTASADYGLRTLAGGQLSIQVSGYLAVQADVAPPLVMEESHSFRDVFAVVREAPGGLPLLLQLRQNTEVICQLTVPAGATASNVVNGFGLPPLARESRLSLDILSAPQGGSGSPGRDLTVTIRL